MTKLDVALALLVVLAVSTCSASNSLRDIERTLDRHLGGIAAQLEHKRQERAKERAK